MINNPLFRVSGPSEESNEALSKSAPFPAETPDSPEEPALASHSREQHTLPAVLSKLDLTVLMLLIILFIANTNGVQFTGPSAFFYWTLGLFTFLIPCAYVTQWLARRFPGQGAPYLWATRILGPRWSFFSAFCAWLPGVLAVVSVIVGGLNLIQYLIPTWFVTPLEQSIAIVLILVVPTAIACLPLRWLKHILLVIAALYVSVFLLLGAAGLLWLKSGHAAALSFNSAAAWTPNSGNFAVYSVVILAYLGVDIPLFMGGEIRGGQAGAHRATSYVWWGTAVAFLAYTMGTFGIMVIVPASQSGSLSANILAIQAVFGPTVGNVTTIVLAVSQVALTIAYILMFSRLLVVVAQDRRLPTGLAKVNRHGVPVRSIIVQALAVAIVTVLSLVLFPMLFGAYIHPDDLALAIYSVMQAGTAVIWVCTIVQLFVFVLWLLYHRTRRVQVPTRQRVLLIVLSLVGTGASLIGIWTAISSSWLPNLISNQNWTILVLGVTVIAFLIGWVGSELPRVNALLSEEKRVSVREMELRAQLQEAYNEQQILVQQQQELVAELNRLYHEQAQAALTDAITGLPNHRAIMSRIDEVVSRCQRTHGSCAVLFVDLDHFKCVNDTWGHRAGDAILHEVGSRLRARLRQEDFVGRYGGEEFAIVLTDVDVHEASQTADRLLAALNTEPCYWETEDSGSIVAIAVTGSIGVAVYQLHGITREELVEHADQAMYQAKHTGRNCVCIATIHADVDAKSVSQAVSQTAPAQGVLQVANEEHTREIVGVQALRAAIAARDRGTSIHSHRLVHLAQAVGHKLKHSEEELHLLRLAAILHDIGKIGIPDAILNKPGSLTDEEWSIMRRHPEIGRQILEELGGVFHQLAEIVVAHHECWDGKGYPHGLAEEAIPLNARILTVVDAYDAMTTHRPYHEPMPVSQARTELQRCSGSQFDPSVVAAFLQVLDEQEEVLSATSPDVRTQRRVFVSSLEENGAREEDSVPNFP